MTDVKEIYSSYADKIFTKRFQSPYPLRRYAHQKEYESILKFVEPDTKVLDAGCGEGVLSILMAQKGAEVIGCDISGPNIAAAENLARQNQLTNIKFLVADAENLPLANNSFDLVISCHVLEHLPDFEKGLAEIKRITKSRAIIALPTCLNLCAACLLGGDNFWRISKRTIYGLPWGILRIFFNLGEDGINEAYVGKKELPHLWRYPWVMRCQIKKAGFRIIHFEASSLCLPYFNFLLPLVKFLDKYKAKPILRNFGYGSFAVVEKD
ncbi:MAG: methyltransferase domain-containing protein [bacterium]